MNTDRAILSGGCFWGMEELFRRQPGVLDTTVGYTGGQTQHPTYKYHAGHAEAIEITFDNSKTTYREILEFMFQIHDPTTKDRQGNDIGSSYRSAIFYLNDEQKQTSEKLIIEINSSGRWPGKVVTEVTPASEFYVAEGYHQDYLQNHPKGYTCHFMRTDWKL